MKTDWLRKEDESEYAYIYRIGNIKEQIGSWQDVADLLNYQLGYQYTESKTARTMRHSANSLKLTVIS